MRKEGTRRVKKVWFVEESAPAKLEGWLSSMAKKGWFLKEVKSFYYVFEEGEPEEMEYRLLYFHKNAFKEQEQRYREAGWDILKLSYEKYLLMAKTRYHPSEEYFTELEKTEWKEKDMSIRWMQVILAIVFFLQAGELISSNAPGVWVNYDLRNRDVAFQLNGLCFGIFALFNVVNYLQGKRYVKQVERLGGMAHHKKSWLYPHTNLLQVVCFITLAVGVIYMTHNKSSQEKIDQVANLPLITAQEIKEGTKKPVFHEEYTKEHWMYAGDRYTAELQLGKEGEYLDEVYYPAFRSLNKRKGLLSILYDGFWLEKGIETEQLEQEGMDEMLYAQDEYEQYIAAQKGKQVLSIRAPKTIPKETLQAMVIKKLS